MTFRTPLLAVTLAALALAGCEGTAGGPSGDADLTGISEADPFEQFAYNAGFQSAEQFLAQDSSFNFERFRDGFRAGLDGDSVEIAYALGLQYGLQFSQDTVLNIDSDIFLAGVREGLAREEARLTPEQAQRAQAAIEDSVQVRQLRSQAAANPMARQRLDQISQNAVRADSFLTAVSQRPGVQRAPSGLLYEVQEEGTGPSPTPGDRVAIRYEGRFANGEVFDQSGEEPTVLPIGGVVEGFREALLGMRVGGQRTIYLSPDLAYGLTGSPGPGGQGGIPPNSALVFDLELVDIVGQQQQPQGLPEGFLPGQ